VRTLLVVIEPPSFDFSSCITEAREPVRIQPFVAQSPVEAFDVGILYWLTRLNKRQPHSAFFTPGRQRPLPKLWPVIEDNGFRQSSLADNPIQDPPHSQSAQRGVDLDRRILVQLQEVTGRDRDR